MPGDKSVRDELLSSSSPFLTLIVILSVIAGLMLIVFLSWVRFRKRIVNQGDESSYNVLVGDSSFIALKDPLDRGDELGVQGRYPIELEDGSRSPPDVVLPEAVVIGLNKTATDAHSLSPIQVVTDVQASLPQLSMEASTPDFSIDALISTHKRLVEQRERFVSDAKHIGLRHMALEHLRMQQRYEKQIMTLKARMVRSH